MFKRRVFTKTVFIGLLLAALIAAALPVMAQGGVRVVANDNLSLRSRPDANSERLGTVPYQTELDATALSPDRNWVAVVYNGQGGWISLAYTGVLEGSLGALNISDQTFTAGGSDNVTSNVVVAPTVNLRYRSEPTLDVRPSGAIPYNTQVPALGLSSDGLFVLVNYNGQNVWIYREYVQEVTGSLNSFVPGAAPSGGSRSGLYVVTAGSNRVHSWNRQVPDEFAAGSADTALLVAYITQNRYSIETCQYTGNYRLERFRVEYVVQLVNADTGETVDTRSFTDDPSSCPSTVWVSSSSTYGTRSGTPQFSQAWDWFAAWLNLLAEQQG